MNDNDNKKYNRVVAYIRKSSEDNKEGKAHKQLNSKRYQEQFVKEAIEKYGLKLVRPPFYDDKTGYEAFVRDNFEEMLEFLKSNPGKVDGVVCTEISRLARNFADGGMVLWYLQSGIIKRIYTHSKVFTNSSTDQMMVAVEFAFSQKSSAETGERTIRGMRSKAKTMKHPARPAVYGYKTTGLRGAKKWIIDSKTAPLLIKIFNAFATGNYTIEQISDYAYYIGARSTSSKSKGGKVSKNTWVNRLKDIQYTGIFYHEGEKIVGKYEPIITDKLFYQVQAVFNRKKHPKSTHMNYAYTGIVACPDCGGMMSGTHKKGHTYYRCGKRKLPCKEIKRTPYIREDKIEQELIKSFMTIEIDNETWLELRKHVAIENEPEKREVRKQIRELNGKIDSEEKLQTDLGRKYAQDKLSKRDYDKLMKNSRASMESLRETIMACENYYHELNELMHKFLDDIKHITKRFESASPLNKRELVEIFCENLQWDGKKVRWDWKKPYFILANQPKSSTMLPD